MLKKAIPLALVTLFATSANATNFSYSSFGVGLAKVSIDGLPEDLQGYGISASVELNENVFLLGSYNYADEEMNNIDISGDTTKIGIGSATAITDKIDAFATLSYATVSAEACGNGTCLKAEDDGYYLSGGLKSWITDSIDVIGTLNYAELDKSDSDGTSYSLGAGFWPAKNHRIGFEMENSEDSRTGIISYSFYPNP
jgi:hypothetical protein